VIEADFLDDVVDVVDEVLDVGAGRRRKLLVDLGETLLRFRAAGLAQLRKSIAPASARSSSTACTATPASPAEAAGWQAVLLFKFRERRLAFQ
jgi:hypothetical protein